MRPAIRPIDPHSEYFTPERCHVNELSNIADDPAVSIARARVEVGMTTRWHRLAGTIERYVILEGRGCVEVGDLAAREIAAGDVVLIPAGCRQRIACVGAQDLVFLAICTPRFRPECYEDVDTSPPAAPT